jgi:hypothetical protein
MEHVLQHEKHAEPPQSLRHAGSSPELAMPQPLGLQLQQQAGNQAMQQLLRRGHIQAKLTIGQTDDPAEQEADRVSSEVMRMPAPASPPQIHTLLGRSPVRRMCADCEEEQNLQRKETAPAPAEAPLIVQDVLGTPGEPLDAGVRAFVEPRFDADFSHVRVHTDSGAAASANAINALAYTSGSHIAFAEGNFSPHTDSGRKLLTHELAHVVQQSSGAQSAVRRSPQTGGSVLFVQVDRAKNTITFVTDSGSLTYTLLTPAEIPVGSYTFSVKFEGPNFKLEAPGEITTFSGFKYRIAAGQPNPADRLHGQKSVTVQVIESGGNSASTNSGTAPAQLAGSTTVPVTFIAYPIDDTPGGTGLPGVSPLTTGLGMGMHNLAFNNLSWLDSPLNSAYWSSLIPRSGIDLERSAVGINTPPWKLPSRLTPSLSTYLAEQNPGDSLTWLSQYKKPIPFRPDPTSAATRQFTADELLSIDSLVRRFATNPGSLTPQEMQLLREAARIHIGGSTPTAPLTSYSRPGTQVLWTNQRRFVVKVKVDRTAALDVSQPNLFNQGADAITNVEEAEFLVVGDQSGRIISVQTVESLGTPNWILRNAGAIRWGGRIVLVAGLAYSGYRIATAKPEEQARVVGEEGGGLLGSLGGSALFTAGCVAFGIATEGVGLLVCGLVGGVVGGAAGSYGGGAFMGGGWINDWVNEASRRNFQHLQELNPGITPAEADRMDDAMENFDTGGVP